MDTTTTTISSVEGGASVSPLLSSVSSAHTHIRTLSFSTSPNVSTALFRGKEHFVVQIVALRGGIIVHPSNSLGPELIPAEVLARSASEWVGRPIVPVHPYLNGEPHSVITPQIAESLSFGFIGDSRYQDNRLILDAWLDPEQAEKVGELATDVINRVRNNQPCSVSISGPVLVEEINGTAPDGTEYTGIWRDLGTYHLAMFNQVDMGACSNSTGQCGTIIGQGYRVLNGSKGGTMAESKKKGRSGFIRSLVNSVFNRALLEDEGISTNDLNWQLLKILRDIEPGDPIIEDIFPDSLTFVYSVWISDDITLYRRAYSIAEDGTVMIGETREEVVRDTVYNIVTTNTDTPNMVTTVTASSNECPCNKPKGDRSMATPNENVKKMVDGLIKAGKVKEGARAGLEMLSEEDLKGLAASDTETTTPATPTTPATTPVSTPTTTETPSTETPVTPVSTPTPTPESPATSEASLAKNLSADDQFILKQLRDAATAQKESLIRVLLGAQSHYDEKALRAKNLEQLTEYSAILGINRDASNDSTNPVYDYSGRGLAIPPTSNEAVPAPPDLKERIMSRKAN